MEKTFFIIKPDGVEKRLVNTILGRAKRKGLFLRKFSRSEPHEIEEKVKEHYVHLKDKPFFDELIAYMTRSPILYGVFEGENAISVWRELLGATNPSEALEGTIRADFGDSVTMENVAHGSANSKDAAREIKLWIGKV